MQIQSSASTTKFYNNGSSATALGLTVDDVQKLIPSPGGKNNTNLWDNIYTPQANDSLFPVYQLLNEQRRLEIMQFEFNKNAGIDADSGDGYQRYLNFYNAKIASLAKYIVGKSSTNDEKVYKIEQWVIENIKYTLDIHNYGMTEYWATPSLTLLRETGDCEDGAFLIHSLALHAGVPIDQLRTYGGFVEIEEGIPMLGGHGWTAYRRESDDEWVEVDWCYYPTDSPLAERTPMRHDTKYFDDFFYFNAIKTVDTTFVNRIRRPSGGSLINIYA